MPMTTGEVIIDHAGGLHEGITDGTANKFKSTFLEILAHCIGLWSSNRNRLQTAPAILFRVSMCETPDEFIEITKFLLNGQVSPGIRNRGIDLEAVTDDACIVHKLILFTLGVKRDPGRIKIVVGLPVVVPFFQYS